MIIMVRDCRIASSKRKAFPKLLTQDLGKDPRSLFIQMRRVFEQHRIPEYRMRHLCDLDILRVLSVYQLSHPLI